MRNQGHDSIIERENMKKIAVEINSKKTVGIDSITSLS